MPDDSGLFLHAHAVVLPFRSLPEGRIELTETVQVLFASTEPVDLLHLITDNRPLAGLGESAFIRGACWCAPACFAKGAAS